MQRGEPEGRRLVPAIGEVQSLRRYRELAYHAAATDDGAAARNEDEPSDVDDRARSRRNAG
jgi:hypothetical protein